MDHTGGHWCGPGMRRKYRNVQEAARSADCVRLGTARLGGDPAKRLLFAGPQFGEFALGFDHQAWRLRLACR